VLPVGSTGEKFYFKCSDLWYYKRNLFQTTGVGASCVCGGVKFFYSHYTFLLISLPPIGLFTTTLHFCWLYLNFIISVSALDYYKNFTADLLIFILSFLVANRIPFLKPYLFHFLAENFSVNMFSLVTGSVCSNSYSRSWFCLAWESKMLRIFN
jgi:hypothetical protein